MKPIRYLLMLLFIGLNLVISISVVDKIYETVYLKTIPFEHYLKVDESLLKRDFAQMNGVYIPTLEKEGIYIQIEESTDPYLHFGFSKGYYQILLYQDEVLLSAITHDFQYVFDQVLETGLEPEQSYNGIVVKALTDTDNRILYFESLSSLDAQSNISYMTWSKTDTLNTLSDGNLDSNITKVTGLVANLSEIKVDSIVLNLINVSDRKLEIIDLVQGDKTLVSEINYFMGPEAFGQVEKLELSLAQFDVEKDYKLYYRYTEYPVVLSAPISVIDNRNEEILSSLYSVVQDAYLKYFDELDGYLTLKEKRTVLDEPLMIPSGYTLVLSAGESIELRNNAYLVSYAPLVWMGTEEEPVKVFSQVGSKSALLVLQTNSPSLIEHVIFDGLGNISDGAFKTTGSVNFYESDVHLTDVIFQNNTAEDMLNVVRSHYEVFNTSFINTYSDAFDSDFSTGSLEYSLFSHTGNDGFDASGSEVTVSNVDFIDIGDKGMSIGEASNITAEAIYIEKSDVGIAVKDGSSLDINSLKLNNIYLGLVQYIKKPIFGSTYVNLTDLNLENSIGLSYLFQEDETFILEGERIEPNNLNKSDQIFDALIEEKELR